MSSAPIPPPSAIQPGREYLIVCSSEEHRYAGHRCITKYYHGRGFAVLGQHVLEANDYWIIDIPGAEDPPPGLSWGARAVWLVDADAGILDALRAGDIVDEVQELTGACS